MKFQHFEQKDNRPADCFWFVGYPEVTLLRDDNFVAWVARRLPAVVASFISAWILRLRAPRFAQDDVQGGVDAYIFNA
jgi:hypothetical protein